MSTGKELRSRAFNLDPRFGYLAEEDHYLFASENPR